MAKYIEFNSFQKAVVGFRQGYGVCVAAPGSGKTAVVAARAQALLREGVEPAKLLSLTFTKEGAKEMTARAGLNTEDKVFSTFHSWALAFVKREYRALPFQVRTDYHGAPAPLCLPQESVRVLAQICRRLHGLKWKDAQLYISTMKRRGITPAMARQLMEHDGELSSIMAYQKYEAALHEKGMLDFDSVVIETANLLEKRPDVLARNQYKYVQIDEAQDTDAVQWRIIRAITEYSGNALAVGDENQGMYSWRGSESNLTDYFREKFPGAAVFPLPINYRSTGAIVNYCKEIAPIKNSTVEQLQTPNEHGIEPQFKLYVLDKDEAREVISSCTDPSKTVILARTNKQLGAFEAECGQRNLRYRLLGKSGFWNQNEVRDVLAIVGAVVLPTDATILRMLGAKCGLTKFLRKTRTAENESTIELLKAFQQRQLDGPDGKPPSLNRLLSSFNGAEESQNQIVHNVGYLLQGLRGQTASLPAKAAVDRILDRFGVLSHYDEHDEDETNFDNVPRENIIQLASFASRKATLSDFYAWTQLVNRALRARSKCLTLSTIHQSKGKEWEDVFVIGVNDQVLPHIRGDEAEEKRIYFVACSRAAKRLQVSACGVPSLFIRDRLPAEPEVEVPEEFVLRQQ